MTTIGPLESGDLDRLLALRLLAFPANDLAALSALAAIGGRRTPFMAFSDAF